MALLFLLHAVKAVGKRILIRVQPLHTGGQPGGQCLLPGLWPGECREDGITAHGVPPSHFAKATAPSSVAVVPTLLATRGRPDDRGVSRKVAEAAVPG